MSAAAAPLVMLRSDLVSAEVLVRHNVRMFFCFYFRGTSRKGAGIPQSSYLYRAACSVEIYPRTVKAEGRGEKKTRALVC